MRRRGAVAQLHVVRLIEAEVPEAERGEDQLARYADGIDGERSILPEKGTVRIVVLAQHDVGLGVGPEHCVRLTGLGLLDRQPAAHPDAEIRVLEETLEERGFEVGVQAVGKLHEMTVGVMDVAFSTYGIPSSMKCDGRGDGRVAGSATKGAIAPSSIGSRTGKFRDSMSFRRRMAQIHALPMPARRGSNRFPSPRRIPSDRHGLQFAAGAAGRADERRQVVHAAFPTPKNRSGSGQPDCRKCVLADVRFMDESPCSAVLQDHEAEYTRARSLDCSCQDGHLATCSQARTPVAARRVRRARRVPQARRLFHLRYEIFAPRSREQGGKASAIVVFEASRCLPEPSQTLDVVWERILLPGPAVKRHPNAIGTFRHGARVTDK